MSLSQLHLQGTEYLMHSHLVHLVFPLFMLLHKSLMWQKKKNKKESRLTDLHSRIDWVSEFARQILSWDAHKLWGSFAKKNWWSFKSLNSRPSKSDYFRNNQGFLEFNEIGMQPQFYDSWLEINVFSIRLWVVRLSAYPFKRENWSQIKNHSLISQVLKR